MSSPDKYLVRAPTQMTPTTPDPEERHVVKILGDVAGRELEKCRSKILHALDLRKKYRASHKQVAKTTLDATKPVMFSMEDGVMCFEGQSWRPIPFWQYVRDLNTLKILAEDGPARSACRKRLSILHAKYDVHHFLDSEIEERLCAATGTDIFTAYKVDNQVGLATCMNAHDLTEFIKTKAVEDAEEVVHVDKAGAPITLKCLMQTVGITDISSLSVQTTGLMPSPCAALYRHFDVFSKRRPRGREQTVRLLKLFLKAAPYQDGRYFAELVKPILQKKQFPKITISSQYIVLIIGYHVEEWQTLAQWTARYELHTPHNRWVIRIPCIEEIREHFKCQSLQEQLDNIFAPLWKASAHPEQHPELAQLLENTVAFNVFSDEPQLHQDGVLPLNKPPARWHWGDTPPDSYFNYYIWANVQSLNYFRSLKGLNTFDFVPNCGEVDSTTHLISAFLLGHAIAGGSCMQSMPVIQYLYYLAQVGVYCSPLASNAEHVPYRLNPFPEFLRTGLRVSLCTADPLHYHHTREPVLEEYGSAGKIFKLGVSDLCEVARNSVLTSSFPSELKEQWLSNGQVTDPYRFRSEFREKTLEEEFSVLREPTDDNHHPSDWHDFTSNHPEVEDYLSFARFDITNHFSPSFRGSKAVAVLKMLLELRQKYIWQPPVEEWDAPLETTEVLSRKFSCELVNGVMCVYDANNVPQTGRVRSLSQFIKDWTLVQEAIDDVDVKTLAHWRLLMLERKFDIYKAVNGEDEEILVDEGEHRDFYQTHKVDTHIHMAAGMTGKMLLDFIIDKVKNHDHDLVKEGPHGPITLGEFFEELKVDVSGLTVDALNVQADPSLFERFDYFNGKYRPMGNTELRDLFLKVDNYMGGRYFAELVKKVFEEMEKDVFTFAENRISIYGKNPSEWSKLAHWYDVHGMWHNHNRWMVQIPRTYTYLYESGAIKSFADLLSNIFTPLWKVSIDPAGDQKLSYFLNQFSGFDCVDNESTLDAPFTDIPPEEWTMAQNPSYHYWIYHLWANIRALNTFRASTGQSTFSFRPHCGESGSISHLSTAFLLANGIAHGINLRHSDPLQYMFYLAQIPMAVSPLSNNSLFLDIQENPFPYFFKRGLNVSLSTDDPLQFHKTQEPLVEEYSIASKIWKLDPTDMCEIARNSVRQSGFPHEVKKHWLGKLYFLASSLSNKPSRSHVPDIRIAFRFEVYHDEVQYLQLLQKGSSFPRSLPTLKEEDATVMKLFGLSREEFLRLRSHKAFAEGNYILSGPKTGVVVKGKAALPFCYRCQKQLFLEIYNAVDSRNYGRLYWRCKSSECQGDGQGMLIYADDVRLIQLQARIRAVNEHQEPSSADALVGCLNSVFPTTICDHPGQEGPIIRRTSSHLVGPYK